MLGLGFTEKKLSRSGFRARNESPDSVIFTQESNFSLFSSTSGSVERCSFGSDLHDHEPFVSDLSKHLAGRDLRNALCGPDLDVSRVSVPNHSNPIKNREKEKAQEGETRQDDDQTLDPTKHSFSHALKECQNQRFRSKKHERQRPVSVDLNNQPTNVASPSPRFMKKTNYRHGGGELGVGFQKGWSSERVPLPTNYSRRYVNAAPFPFNNGRNLPSKWEDAEKWIFSPVTGEGINRPSTLPPVQRRPKSKSGPLGMPGMACYSSPSIGNFTASSPFSAGVLVADRLRSQRSCGDDDGGGGSYTANREPSMGRSASVNVWTDLLIESSLPSSQDEKLDGTKDAGTMILPAVSRKDMATQMSPEGSPHSSPKERPCFSPPNSVLPIEELQGHLSFGLQVRDVQVDDRVTVTRWSKKHGSRRLSKDPTDSGEWKKNAIEARSSAWEVSDAAKCISKFKREEAKITAWENLQKAKAEAEIRKLEVKLEKIRNSSMDKIMNKLRSAQRKAQEMRSSVSTTQSNQVARWTSHKVMSFRETRKIRSLSGCFTCHAV
ncbi:remorin family protein [Tasmannia lanceolata]|uniref:remorin family protein n=1 Tax=Tasmannia lanceolata TaxID=3420 RepID=UPI0040632E71